MATIQVTVPVNDNDQYQRAWTAYVGGIIDAGNDVQFIDSDENGTEVNFINVAVDATVLCRGLKTNPTDRTGIYLLAGAWHMMPIYMIYANGTTASSLAVVALRDR